jgi:TolB protein
MDLASGNRQIIYTVPYSIQAPNFSNDGQHLIFNGSDDLIYNFDLKSRTPQLINTGNVKSNNNDHVVSFDGKMICLSSTVQTVGGSIIYTVPVAGGTLKQIIPKVPS